MQIRKILGFIYLKFNKKKNIVMKMLIIYINV